MTTSETLVEIMIVAVYPAVTISIGQDEVVKTHAQTETFVAHCHNERRGTSCYFI